MYHNGTFLIGDAIKTDIKIGNLNYGQLLIETTAVNIESNWIKILFKRD